MLGGGATISNSEPRINALRIQQSTYGAAIPICIGTTRLTGNLIDYEDFTAIAHTTTTTSGGKGGGSVTSENTSYTYTAAGIILLCEAFIEKIGQVWSGKEITTLSELDLSLYQSKVWPYMQGRHPDKALAYKNTAYLAGVIDLGSSGEVPNLSFETFGLYQYGNGIIDANPAEAVRQLLINKVFGVNFPEDCIGDFSLYSNYCVATGLFIALALTEQKECRENISGILKCTNSEAVWSQGKLKPIPYCDEEVSGNGVTYTPPPAPLYDLTDDDFLSGEGEEPVICYRGRASDAYNVQPYEFINRENSYNIESDDVRDPTNVREVGIRQGDTIQMHYFCDKEAANMAAQGILQRNLYKRNTYEFKVGWKYYLLEPMDIITLTESSLSLVKEPVRVITIEEIDDQKLKILAEECPAGVHGVTKYPSQTAERPELNYNAPPGDVNAPVIFEPPPELTGGNLTAWVAVSGQSTDWGGCNVWVSQDGDTYARVGTITAPSRTGVLTAPLPAGTSPDIVNILPVDLSESRGQLLTSSRQEADDYVTLCCVDGELISYQTATLKDKYQYDLSYLVRGIYDTETKAHPSGSRFVRLTDKEIFKYNYTDINVGQSIYIKFTSFNIFGLAGQDLADVAAYRHTLTNKGKGSPSSYQHIQSTPAAVWEITHNLNKIPSVITIDNDGNTIMGMVAYPTLNTVTITFSEDVVGRAYLN